MSRMIHVFVLSLFVQTACHKISNRVESKVLDCGEDFVDRGDPWFRAESSSGALLTRDEFELIETTHGANKSLEISSKGCFSLKPNSEWVLRSIKLRESKLFNSSALPAEDRHRIRLETNKNDDSALICPAAALNASDLTLGKFVKINDMSVTRLQLNFAVYDSSNNKLMENNGLIENPSLSLAAPNLADGLYQLKFQVKDLRRDQSRDHACEVELDNTAPEIDVDQSHMTSSSMENQRIFVIPREEQLRFVAKAAEKNLIRVEYCFIPGQENKPASYQDCDPAKVKTAEVDEPISPSKNSGVWELHYSGIDIAGNRSNWKHLAPIVYADSASMQKIELESRPDMIQTEISKVTGIFDVLHKAFVNYKSWKNLATSFERSQSRNAILSLFYAAHIGMNNDSPFISLNGRTNNMIMSADGRQMIVGLYNGEIQVIDMETKKKTALLSGHGTAASSFSLSADNKILVSGSFDQTIKVWDLEAKVLLHTLPCCQGEFLRVAISPDKKYIVSTSWDKILKIWNFDGTLKKSISLDSNPDFHQDVIHATKISPDGKYLATGSWDRTVKLWDLATGDFVRKMQTDHGDGVNDIGFTYDSTQLISAGKDGQVLVHSVADGTLNKRLATLSASVTSIDVGISKVITGSLDSVIRVWNLETAQQVDGPFKVEYFGMGDVVINSAGSIFASTVNTSILRFWGTTGQSNFVNTWYGHTANSSIRSLALDAKHNRLFSGGTDGKLMAWDMKTGIGSTVDQSDTIYDMKMSPTKDYLYTSSKDGRLRRYGIESLAVEEAVFEKTGTWLFSLDFDPISSKVYMGSWDGLVIAESEEKSFTDAKVSTGWSKVIFEPKEAKLLVLSRDKFLGQWDPNSKTIVKRLGFSDALISGKISADGKSLFVGLWCGLVESIDLASFSGNYRFDAEGGIVWDLWEDQMTGYLLTASNDGKVRIWNPQNRQLVGVPLKIASKAVRTLSYSDKDGTLITGDDDGLVKAWNLPLTTDIELMKNLVCAQTAEVLESPWFIGKYGVELQALCRED